MIGNWQMRSLEMPERFTAYALAYLRASRALCNDIADRPAEYEFPDANVVLMLAAHAVELFLKGLILERNASFEIVSHRLDLLRREFDRLYPEPKFKWDIPFAYEYAGFSEQELVKLSKDEIPPSIRFRYPANSSKVAWSGVHAFNPDMFLKTLDRVDADFYRIQKAAAHCEVSKPE